MNSLLIGTSGYSYKDWEGPVYPAGTVAKDYLTHYEKQFNFTELNFSYYKQPDPRTLARLVNGTGDDFIFAIKAHKSITHEISTDYKKHIATFREGIQPLIESSKLGVVVLQFPFSFHYDADARRYLSGVCKGFAKIPTAVEFRNAEWQRESVYKGLKEYGVVYVNVDEPDLAGLPKPSAVVTAHLAYIRFHGRNKEKWWSGDNTSRYDYSYPDAELAQWIPRIMVMVSQTAKTMVAFNNHWNGQAVTNAKRLREMVERET
jgi:uncharacterized protein YecE (DUF72 family)